MRKLKAPLKPFFGKEKVPPHVRIQIIDTRSKQMYERQCTIASFHNEKGFPTTPDQIKVDGDWHDLRFPDGRKIGYVVTVLSSGSFYSPLKVRKTKEKFVYRSWEKEGHESPSPRDALEMEERENEKARDAEQKKLTARNFFNNLLKLAENHHADYLKLNKKLEHFEAPFGHHQALGHKDELGHVNLLVGGYDENGLVCSYQTITRTGKKLWAKGPKSAGLFFDFVGSGDKWVLCEGWADGYVIRLLTGLNVRVAFSNNQLRPVLKKMVKAGISTSNIMVLADCDGANWNTKDPNKLPCTNPGYDECFDLAEEFGVQILVPSTDVTAKLDIADLWTKDLKDEAKKVMGNPWEPQTFMAFMKEQRELWAQNNSYVTDGSGGNKEPLDVVAQGIVRKVGVEQDVPRGTLGGGGEGNVGILEEGGNGPLETLGGTTSGTQEKSVPRGTVAGECGGELLTKLKNPGSGEASGPLVKKVVSKWEPKKFDIKTRETGFWIVIPPTDKREKEKWIPDYQGLRDYFDELYIYKSTMGKYVWKWNGKFYEEVEPGALRAFAEEHFNPKPLEKVRAEFCHKITANNYVSKKFFKVARKVNFQNGWLDLDKMEFSRHSPEVGFMNVLGYDFDESARCPQWDKFLDQVMGGDEELALLVNEYIGYILTGDDIWEQKALMLKGEGSNGKSTLLDLVRELIGRENATAHSLDTLNKDKSSVAGLEGKLANISDETPKEALLDSNTFKLLSAGGTISARKLYGDFFEFQNSAKFVFSTNDFGGTKDQTFAFWRRFLICPFEQTFDEKTKDPLMLSKLLTELPGIFNKTVKLYLEAKERKSFTVSARSVEQVKFYQLESNPVLQWKDDRAIIQDKGSEGFEVISKSQVMYQDYRHWALDRGYQPLTDANFGKALRRALPNPSEVSERFGHTYGTKVERWRGVKGITKKNGAPFTDGF